MPRKGEEKKGDVIYAGTNEIDDEFFKVGITKNVNSRSRGLSGSTSSDFVMKKFWYTKFNKQIEDAIKINFYDERLLLRKELYDIKY